jgi:hypothetical protein
LFKKSLLFLKKHYAAKRYSFTLDASDRNEGGLNQKVRIHIFHSAGFHINPETGYFTKDGDYTLIKTRAILDTKEAVEIQKKEGNTYYVKDDEGKTYSISIDNIEKCLDADSKQISCPMIMMAAARRTRRKTQRKRSRKV